MHTSQTIEPLIERAFHGAEDASRSPGAAEPPKRRGASLNDEERYAKVTLASILELDGGPLRTLSYLDLRQGDKGNPFHRETELARDLGVSPTTITKHLDILLSGGWVSVEKHSAPASDPGL